MGGGFGDLSCTVWRPVDGSLGVFELHIYSMLVIGIELLLTWYWRSYVGRVSSQWLFVIPFSSNKSKRSIRSSCRSFGFKNCVVLRVIHSNFLHIERNIGVNRYGSSTSWHNVPSSGNSPRVTEESEGLPPHPRVWRSQICTIFAITLMFILRI